MPRTIKNPATVPEPLWTDQEVSTYLRGMSVRTLANWRTAKIGPPFIRIGKGHGATIFYHPASVEAWAKEQEVGTSAVGA